MAFEENKSIHCFFSFVYNYQSNNFRFNYFFKMQNKFCAWAELSIITRTILEEIDQLLEGIKLKLGYNYTYLFLASKSVVKLVSVIEVNVVETIVLNTPVTLSTSWSWY